MWIRHALRTAGLIFLLLSGGAPAAAQITLAQSTSDYQARLEAAINALSQNSRLDDLPFQKRRGIVEFVAGNMLFALLHEMGHARITEMGLPVLGREEDAADSLAVLTLLEMGSSFSYDILVEAATGWFLSSYRDEKQGIKIAYYDMHGLDRQRAYNIVCLMVGSDGERFKPLADRIGMPEDRQETCRGDYSNASWSWNQVMKPHRRAPDQPKTEISVVYGEAEGDLGLFGQTARSLRVLEKVAYHESEQFVWRRPFTIEMQTCGTAGAQWDLLRRRVTLCYELAAEFAELYRGYGDRIALPRFR